MDPVTISLIVGLALKALDHVPDLLARIAALKAKGEPTAADWDQLRAELAEALQYKTLVPHSKLPVNELDEQS